MVVDAERVLGRQAGVDLGSRENSAPAADEDHASRALHGRRSDGWAAGFGETVGGRGSVAALPLRSTRLALIDVKPALSGGSAQRPTLSCTARAHVPKSCGATAAVFAPRQRRESMSAGVPPASL